MGSAASHRTQSVNHKANRKSKCTWVRYSAPNSDHHCSYQADYGCQKEPDERQLPTINVFQKINGGVFHFWAAEIPTNNIDVI